MTTSIRLGNIAHARSGDKGNHANIGVIARSPDAFARLQSELTADVVHDFFGRQASRVERFELPGINGFNFLLYDILAGGASQSMRIDTQGKTLGPALLELRLPGGNGGDLDSD